jgi:hypothetical protein
VYDYVIIAISSPLNLKAEDKTMNRYQFHLNVRAESFAAARSYFKTFMPGVQIEKIAQL